MVSPDRLLKCQSCGITFLVTSQGLSPGALTVKGAEPRLCPGCATLERLCSRRRGIVKWFDPRRGYGFIEPDQGSEVFFHRSDLQPDGRHLVLRGLKVEMEIEETGQGQRARHILLLTRGS